MSNHLDEDFIHETIQQLKIIAQRAYAPYSHFQVASAIVFTDDIIYGVNVENASYGLTNCAERNCLSAAIAQGKQPKEAIAFFVYHHNKVISSCGACRQVMSELLKKETPVIFASEHDYIKTSVAQLLPLQFSQEDLQ